MNYVVGSVAALIGNVTPNRPKTVKRALTPIKHQPSPNITPKSDVVDDRSIFLSPSVQKKKAIVKKSPKRIFQNTDLDVTNDEAHSSPKADKVKKHLENDLKMKSSEDKNIDRGKSPKNERNNSVNALPAKETMNVSVNKNTISNESTPKKKNKKKKKQRNSVSQTQNERIGDKVNGISEVTVANKDISVKEKYNSNIIEHAQQNNDSKETLRNKNSNSVDALPVKEDTKQIVNKNAQSNEESTPKKKNKKKKKKKQQNSVSVTQNVKIEDKVTGITEVAVINEDISLNEKKENGNSNNIENAQQNNNSKEATKKEHSKPMDVLQTKEITNENVNKNAQSNESTPKKKKNKKKKKQRNSVSQTQNERIGDKVNESTEVTVANKDISLKENRGKDNSNCIENAQQSIASKEALKSKNSNSVDALPAKEDTKEIINKNAQCNETTLKKKKKKKKKNQQNSVSETHNEKTEDKVTGTTEVGVANENISLKKKSNLDNIKSVQPNYDSKEVVETKNLTQSPKKKRENKSKIAGNNLENEITVDNVKQMDNIGINTQAAGINNSQISKKKNKKRKKSKVRHQENLGQEDKTKEQQDYTEENNEPPKKKKKQNKTHVNANAVTDKDTDSEHESDNDMEESENEKSNKEVLDAGTTEDSSDNEEEQKQPEKKEVEVNTEDELRRTLFVGNVPFSKKCKKEIKKIFSKYGQIDTVRIRTVPVKDASVTPKMAVIKGELHPDRSTVNVYVKFSDPASVEKALQENNTVLNDHHLRVTRSNSTGAEHDPRCSIFVGNLPFTLEDDALRVQFEKCGAIDSVRIIRDRITKAGKGFGYVNFASKDGVELALNLSDEDLTMRNRILRVKRCTQLSQRQKQRPQGRDSEKRFVGKFGRNLQGNKVARNQYGQNQSKDGAYRRILHKREQKGDDDGPPNKRARNFNEPSREKKSRKEFVGMTAEKRKKPKFNKAQKKNRALSEILTK